MRIWIDTDVGSDVDDALAIAYVARHPDFELVGVSTVFGDIPVRTRIAEALLDLAGEGHVPVLPGLGVPITPRRRGVMFGFEGKGIIDGPEPIARIASEEGGPQRIAALAEAIGAAQPDVVLAIGPLTNLAALLESGVALPPLAIMGGKLDDVMIEGMSEAIFEWNWFSDSDAAQTVIEAPHAKRPLVVPGEVTFRTRLAPGDLDLLAAGDSLCQMLAILSQGWLNAQRDLFSREDPWVALHDPLTAALLVQPDLCVVKPRHIVFGDDGVSRAQAMNPIDGAPMSVGANVDAAIDVDPAAARDDLMAVLLRS